MNLHQLPARMRLQQIQHRIAEIDRELRGICKYCSKAYRLNAERTDLLDEAQRLAGGERERRT